MKGARRIMYIGTAVAIAFVWVFVLERQQIAAITYGMGYATGCAVTAAAVYWARSRE